MHAFKLSTKKTATLVGALLAAAVLAACGSGSSSNDGVNTDPVAVTPPAAIDAFYARVAGIVSVSNEDGEPVSTDAISTTAPEDNEAVPFS